jgi:hypothetical protein
MMLKTLSGKVIKVVDCAESSDESSDSGISRRGTLAVYTGAISNRLELHEQQAIESNGEEPDELSHVASPLRDHQYLKPSSVEDADLQAPPLADADVQASPAEDADIQASPGDNADLEASATKAFHLEALAADIKAQAPSAMLEEVKTSQRKPLTSLPLLILQGIPETNSDYSWDITSPSNAFDPAVKSNYVHARSRVATKVLESATDIEASYQETHSQLLLTSERSQNKDDKQPLVSRLMFAAAGKQPGGEITDGVNTLEELLSGKVEEAVEKAAKSEMFRPKKFLCFAIGFKKLKSKANQVLQVKLLSFARTPISLGDPLHERMLKLYWKTCTAEEYQGPTGSQWRTLGFQVSPVKDLRTVGAVGLVSLLHISLTCPELRRAMFRLEQRQLYTMTIVKCCEIAVDNLRNGVLNAAIDRSGRLSNTFLKYVVGLVEVCCEDDTTIQLELVQTEGLFSAVISSSQNTRFVLCKARSRLSFESKAVA